MKAAVRTVSFSGRFIFPVMAAAVACALVLGFWGALSPAQAQDLYPAERIVWVTPYKAGGGYDLLSRSSSPYLTRSLRELSPGAKGGNIILKNEPAASGRKAYTIVYNAKPDGYTIGGFDSAFATESLLTPLEFDLNRFTYLVRLMLTTRVLVTAKNGFAGWAEMLKAARTKELKWGVGAFGRALHVDSILVKEEVGIPARFIAWGGTAEAMNAMMRGDISVAMVSEDSVQGLIKAGEIRVLAQFSEKSSYPGIPSIKDLGYPDLAEKLGGHRFVMAPPALPEKIKNRLVAAFQKTLQDREFQAWARKSEIPLDPLYGADADRVAKRMFKFYQQDAKPLLKKYL